ncbi:SRPBCC family protein [Micromonospora sp. NPDC049559]|uniref:SRPBCC family protein n=1 Tax=Micromonospora sp. NPDC049559 TaxID=3155923 RepID=UPI0034195412
MIDIIDEINAIRRRVGQTTLGESDARVVVAERGYDAAIEDVWDAITTPERLTRWFLPVSGDLRPGGTYQFTGNAGGRILRCEPPRLLRVTWIFGEHAEAGGSEVEVRLRSDAPERTTLELEHVAAVDPAMWDRYGPGAVGVGWDLTLLGLGLHLGGTSIGNPDEWAVSPEGRGFATSSSEAWGAAYGAAGASSEVVATAIRNTTGFYAPEPGPTGEGTPVSG